MRILQVHESYQQRGGEDEVAEAEARQLELNGHNVSYYRRHNDEIAGDNTVTRIATGIGTVWALRSHREMDALIAKENPEVVHFHNTFPLISPSAYYACAKRGIPVVQTLHNYRLVCPGATFLREGRVCEACLGRAVAWRAVAHSCYRGSRLASAATTAMLAAHKVLRTWQLKVDAYVALSEFARRKFIAGGLPARRIVVKPNFVDPDPGSDFTPRKGKYGLFVGRLSQEKGLRGLLAAWKRLAHRVPLVILGDGPMRQEVEQQVRELGAGPQVTVMGNVPREEVFRWMRDACFLVCPSHWFEGCPLVVVEAFACGLPVIATGHGPTAEMIEHERTGLHVSPGEDSDLAAKVEWAWGHAEEMKIMQGAARREYERKYTAERNYTQLMNLYRELIVQKETGLLAERMAAISNGDAS
jgi:glycosyltransferase involved in cell wall biosynthesis